MAAKKDKPELKANAKFEEAVKVLVDTPPISNKELTKKTKKK